MPARLDRSGQPRPDAEFRRQRDMLGLRMEALERRETFGVSLMSAALLIVGGAVGGRLFVGFDDSVGSIVARLGMTWSVSVAICVFSVLICLANWQWARRDFLRTELTLMRARWDLVHSGTSADEE